jgi:molecular chaperone HtpG
MGTGTNLYSRKVLIQPHSDNILPEWLRFVRGVVDSEDIPLNISRETAQDSALLAKLQRVINRPFSQFPGQRVPDNPEKYAEFWTTSGMFIKEGATADFAYRKECPNCCGLNPQPLSQASWFHWLITRGG